MLAKIRSHPMDAFGFGQMRSDCGEPQWKPCLRFGSLFKLVSEICIWNSCLNLSANTKRCTIFMHESTKSRVFVLAPIRRDIMCRTMPITSFWLSETQCSKKVCKGCLQLEQQIAHKLAEP